MEMEYLKNETKHNPTYITYMWDNTHIKSFLSVSMKFKTPGHGHEKHEIIR